MEKSMELLHRARVDVEKAFMIWKEIFLEIFEDEIKYAYAKGSAVKHWDGPIDYVPILSDIDIHDLKFDKYQFLTFWFIPT